jgi:hypothetical protein
MRCEDVPDFLSVAPVEIDLGVGRGCVYALIRRKELPRV